MDGRRSKCLPFCKLYINPLTSLRPWAAATAAIVKAGTPCLLAAGNDGSEGMYYASSASAGQEYVNILCFIPSSNCH